MANSGTMLEWSQITSENPALDGKIPFLNLKSGNSYRVRPILRPVEVWKYFVRDQAGRLRTAICADPKTCPVAAKHKDLKPTLRYGMFVIDRRDRRLKVMEGPRCVFKDFGEWFNDMGKDPGGKDGFDWSIKVTGTGLMTKYKTTALEATPLNEEQRAKIREEIGENGIETYFKPHTSEEIENRLYGAAPVSSSNSASAPQETATEQGKAAPPEAAADDLNF